jgi:hypothetical protein
MKVIIFPIILYGFAAWSLKLRQEQGLLALRNRVLREIFEPRKEEETGEWIKLRGDQLHVWYCSHHVISAMKSRRFRWIGHMAHRPMVEMRST